MPAGVSAWTPLANIILSSSATSVTFSSISSAYRDLVLIARSASDSPSNQMQIRFNSDASGSYNYVQAWRAGASSSLSDFASNQTRIVYGRNGNSSTLGSSTARIEIFDYATTDKHKQVILRNLDIDSNNTNEFTVYRYAQTSAINSITITSNWSNAVNMVAGTSFALYGVSA